MLDWYDSLILSWFQRVWD